MISRLAKSTESRPRDNLRLEPEDWYTFDAARSRRPGNDSPNTWITEAVLKELTRDSNDNDKKRGRNV